ncbi:MAG: DUF3298 domain-containing protein [Bacteroidaceae bacterium]|nr:DUF3298 domain-containing protein [Bacteroidaceae bacterium]
MRKRGYIIIIAAAALALTSCDWASRMWQSVANDGAEADSTEATAYCTAEFTDSINVNNAVAYQEIRADFPSEADTSTLAQIVLEWLCNEVRSRCWPDPEGTGFDSAFAVGEELDNFADNVVTTYGRKGLEQMEADLRDMAQEGYEGFFSNRLSIELLERSSERITFALEHDVYLGGAHGGQYLSGTTFSAANGEPFTWKHFNMEKRAELIELLKKGLMAYFNNGAEEPITTETALLEQLILYDNPDTPENELEYGLPLPVTAPWITRDGVCFVYQEYEIAAYACGRPFVVLPFEVVEPFLTEDGRKFISLK